MLKIAQGSVLIAEYIADCMPRATPCPWNYIFIICSVSDVLSWIASSAVFSVVDNQLHLLLVHQGFVDSPLDDL